MWEKHERERKRTNPNQYETRRGGCVRRRWYAEGSLEWRSMFSSHRSCHRRGAVLDQHPEPDSLRRNRLHRLLTSHRPLQSPLRLAARGIWVEWGVVSRRFNGSRCRPGPPPHTRSHHPANRFTGRGLAGVRPVDNCASPVKEREQHCRQRSWERDQTLALDPTVHRKVIERSPKIKHLIWRKSVLLKQILYVKIYMSYFSFTTDLLYKST